MPEAVSLGIVFGGVELHLPQAPRLDPRVLVRRASRLYQRATQQASGMSAARPGRKK